MLYNHYDFIRRLGLKLTYYKDYHMLSRTTTDFQKNVLKHLTFKPHEMSGFTLYKNDVRPELGFFMKYSRQGYYDFNIGDYTIPEDFSLCFSLNEELMRFGTVYMGETNFKIDGNPLSSFTPSSFFVVERNLSGRQTWKKGTHYHGAEITIHKRFMKEVIAPHFNEYIYLDDFMINHTYHHLSVEIAGIIQQLKQQAMSQHLTSLYLESKVLEALSFIWQELRTSPDNVFTHQLDYGKVKIGNDRFITLSASDVHAIQKAYTILTQEACNPPTLAELSKRVFLNEQKLKAGFAHKYHMPIRQYTLSLRMTMAENLLSTTDISIESIAQKVGYNHTSNFVNSFKKYHGLTPLAFRKRKHTI